MKEETIEDKVRKIQSCGFIGLTISFFKFLWNITNLCWRSIRNSQNSISLRFRKFFCLYCFYI